MADYWQTDQNPSESHEEQHEHQVFHSIKKPLSPSQISLGFDPLVDEIRKKIPLYKSEIEENTYIVPSIPNWDSKRCSLDEAHQISLNEFIYKNPEHLWQQFRETPAIGFRPSVLPKPQNINKESSQGNPIEKYTFNTDYRFNLLAPSFASFDKINSCRELRNESSNCHIGFESSILPIDPSSTDFMPKEDNKRNGNMDTVETSPLPPKTWINTWPKNMELKDCSIQLVEVPQGSNRSLISFCDKVKKIRETYHAADMNSNSGKIWSITTAFPYQLFSNTKFNINVFTDSSTQLLRFMPYANYFVRDLIEEILHFCTNDQLFPKDHLLSVCGSEEFLQKSSNVHLDFDAKKLDPMYEKHYQIFTFTFSTRKYHPESSCVEEIEIWKILL